MHNESSDESISLSADEKTFEDFIKKINSLKKKGKDDKNDDKIN
jgi:hypothetical protein